MDDQELSIKITLIGDSAVGKTSIINKFTKNKFNAEILPTTGANYSQKVITKFNKSIRLDLWDTAGQEEYRAIGRFFYKEAYIVCLVYDITNEVSFENLKNIWYNELMEHGEEYKVVAVIGNKSDLYIKEKVPEEEAREYASEIKALFRLTSAKNGNGVEEIFDELVDKYYYDIEVPKLLVKNNDKKDEKKIKITKDNIKKKGKKKCCED